jgi:hypothetical protein
MTLRDRQLRFLEEYELLCRKFDIIVGSCGCCNSPWIDPPGNGETIELHLADLRSKVEKEL